ncbi:hypothetical protein N7528_007926 [Penicillium herquei]|nr:hypothetical protein N7528_007926 [Penicillium herquei]
MPHFWSYKNSKEVQNGDDTLIFTSRYPPKHRLRCLLSPVEAAKKTSHHIVYFYQAKRVFQKFHLYVSYWLISILYNLFYDGALCLIILRFLIKEWSRLRRRSFMAGSYTLAH